MIKSALIVTCALLFGALQLHSQTIVDWYLGGYGANFGTPPPSASAYADFASGALVGDFQMANGAATASPDFGVAGAFVPVIGTPGSISLENLDSSRYTSFTLSAQAGQLLNVTGLTYAMWNPQNEIWGGGGGPVPTNAMWGYRIDDGPWHLQNDGAGIILPTTQPTSSANYATWNFDPFNTTGTVEFALWAWGGTSDFPEYAFVGVGASIGGGFDPSLSVNGSVTAVPEPSTYFYFGIALGVFAVLRRRAVRVKQFC